MLLAHDAHPLTGRTRFSNNNRQQGRRSVTRVVAVVTELRRPGASGPAEALVPVGDLCTYEDKCQGAGRQEGPEGDVALPALVQTVDSHDHDAENGTVEEAREQSAEYIGGAEP